MSEIEKARAYLRGERVDDPYRLLRALIDEADRQAGAGLPDEWNDWIIEQMRDLNHAIALLRRDAPREGEEERMAHDFPALADFFDRYALGPKLPPSCLCCGQLPDEVVIQHAELPGIVVCRKCRDATHRPQPAGEAAVALMVREDDTPLGLAPDEETANYWRNRGYTLRPVSESPPTDAPQAAKADNSRAGCVTVPRCDLLALLEGNLAAANIALSMHPLIDRIEENGGPEADDDTEQMAYYLYYTLPAAARLRDIAEKPE